MVGFLRSTEWQHQVEIQDFASSGGISLHFQSIAARHSRYLGRNGSNFYIFMSQITVITFV